MAFSLVAVTAALHPHPGGLRAFRNRTRVCGQFRKWDPPAAHPGACIWI